MATTQDAEIAQTTPPPPREHTRTGLSAELLLRAIRDNLHFVLGRHPTLATHYEWFRTVAYTLRDRIMDRWIRNVPVLLHPDVRVVSYLSAEFLIGPQLMSHVVALDAEAALREALVGVGWKLEDLAGLEEEPGLGNGGLGRLAACFLESLASLRIPAFGYGIR